MQNNEKKVRARHCAARWIDGLLRGTAITALAASAWLGLAQPALAAGGSSELSDEPAPMLPEEELPARVPPLIEIGPDFLGTGNIPEGIELPTGAVWTPALWVYGSSRSAVQYFDNGDGPEHQEAVTRLDLFANLHLTPTERLLLGISPLRDEGSFTRCSRKPEETCRSEANLDITTLFFEGEFGEIFPNLDPSDSKSLDIGFSVGRQQLFFQEGFLVNDTVDGFGITRDNIILPNVVDIRVTGFWGWNNIDRDNNLEDDDASLYGLFTEADFRAATANFDVIYVDSDERTSDGDGLYFGASSVQRFGLINTAFRAVHSIALDDGGDQVDDGTVLFGEASKTLPYGNDLVYVNAFAGFDHFSSAARDPTAGGPLGRTGILFAAVGLGNYGAALGNRADESYGAAVGYQMFFNNEATQLVLEAGGRDGLDGQDDAGALAVGARFQHSFGSRFVFQVDGFLAANEGRKDGAGLRSEFLIRF